MTTICPQNLKAAPPIHPWDDGAGGFNWMKIDDDGDGVDGNEILNYNHMDALNSWFNNHDSHDTCRFLDEEVGGDGDLCINYYNSEGKMCENAALSPSTVGTECIASSEKCSDYPWCDEERANIMRPLLLNSVNNDMEQDEPGINPKSLEDMGNQDPQRCSDIPFTPHGIYNDAPWTTTRSRQKRTGAEGDRHVYFYEIGWDGGDHFGDESQLDEDDDRNKLSSSCVWGGDSYEILEADVGTVARTVSRCKERCITKELLEGTVMIDDNKSSTNIFDCAFAPGHEECKICVSNFVQQLGQKHADPDYPTDNYHCNNEQVAAICDWLAPGVKDSPCCWGGQKCKDGFICKVHKDNQPTQPLVPVSGAGQLYYHTNEAGVQQADYKHCGKCVTPDDDGTNRWNCGVNGQCTLVEDRTGQYRTEADCNKNCHTGH